MSVHHFRRAWRFYPVVYGPGGSRWESWKIAWWFTA